MFGGSVEAASLGGLGGVGGASLAGGRAVHGPLGLVTRHLVGAGQRPGQLVGRRAQVGQQRPDDVTQTVRRRVLGHSQDLQLQVLAHGRNLSRDGSTQNLLVVISTVKIRGNEFFQVRFTFSSSLRLRV